MIPVVNAQRFILLKQHLAACELTRLVCRRMSIAEQCEVYQAKAEHCSLFDFEQSIFWWDIPSLQLTGNIDPSK